MKPKKFLPFIFTAALICNPAFSEPQQNPALFNCIMTDKMIMDYVPDDDKSTFPITAPIIYVTCESLKTYKGQTLRSVWVATDTNDKIVDEKTITVQEPPPQDMYAHFIFSLVKSKQNWTKGAYRFELYVDGKLDFTINYSVK